MTVLQGEPLSKGIFSVIVALYGVEKYVDTFLRSLERQTFPFADLEVIIVDDGSLDRSYDIVKRWANRYPGVIRHTTKSNGGPASARNIGLDMATNEWVTFCDPDDALQAEYFQRVEEFLQRDFSNKASMLTSRVMIWQEETNKISDTHPLAAKYSSGDRLVNLDEEPNYIQLGGASTFLRNSVLQERNLRFDERIKPTFEDAELIGRYLGGFPNPIVGLVSTARYLYRKRGDGSSLVQSSWGRIERYDDVLRFGYLGLLRGLKTENGTVPRWAQNMVLYDVQWYLTEDKKMHSASAWLPEENLDVFHELLRRIFSYIDTEAVREYNVTSMSWLTRTAILTHFKGQGFRLQPVVVWSGGRAASMKLGYGYSGELPEEQFEIDGQVAVPTSAKSVAHTYYGQVFFYERMVWLPAGKKILPRLNGMVSPIQPARPKPWNSQARPSSSNGLLPKPAPRLLGERIETRFPLSKKVPQVREFATRIERVSNKLENRVRIEQLLSGSSAPVAATIITRRIIRRRNEARSLAESMSRDKEIVAWAMSEHNRTKFMNAWLVMDRLASADDNGEHLYRYLKENQHQTNAWFLLNKSSPDWKRLAEEGFRLVDSESDEAVALTLNASYKISSDATYDSQFPVSPSRFGAGKGKIVFLQHGVTKDDLSRWLNPKAISMIVTATKKEYDSIAGSETPYRFTPKEVKLTGFPRYDQLLHKAHASPAASRPYILVMPTWRQDLKTAMDECSTYDERLEVFESSQYGRSWISLLNSTKLRAAADREGLEIVYVLHPSLATFTKDIDIPGHVRAIHPNDVSFQDLFTKTKFAITDYSSIAFDAALSGSSIAYFQFDANDIFNGKHNYRRGYYDYMSDGFGPVANTLVEMENIIHEYEQSHFNVLARYETRVAETFAFRDTRNCERVFTEIRNL